MARQLTTGFELADAFADGVNVSGTTAYDTTTKRSGSRSLKCSSHPTLGTPAYVSTGPVSTQTPLYFRAALNFAHLPTTDAWVFGASGSPASGVSVRLTTTGMLRFYRNNGGGVQIGSDYAISTGVWYVVEVMTQYGAGATDNAECRVTPDGGSTTTLGTLTAGDTGTDSAPATNWGWVSNPGTAKDVYVDDVGSNDASGVNQNTWLGPAKIVTLLPISDNARSTEWTGGAGGTTNLYDAVNNTPPVGTATETNLTQIEHAGGAVGNYDANMTSYASAGLVSGDTVTLVVPVFVHGEDVATGTKLLNFAVVSNPVIAEGTSTIVAGSDNGALATYPSFWTMSYGGQVATRTDVAHNPSVTLATSPVMRVRRPETASRVASVCLMAMVVEYTSTPSTPVSVNDTGSLSATEDAPSVSPTSVVSVNDTATTTGADAITALDAAHTRADTGTITGSDGRSVSGSADLARSDTGSLAGVDGQSVASSRDVADTGLLGGSETQSVTTTTTASGSDTGSLTGSDVGSVASSVTATDTGSFAGIEATAISSTVAVSVADTGSIGGTEAPSVATTTTNRRALVSWVAVELPAAAQLPSPTDSGVLAGSESVSVASSRTLTDTGTIAGVDAQSIASSRTVADTGTITGSDATSVATTITLVDTGTITGVDAQSVAEGVATPSASDTGAITGAETPNVGSQTAIAQSDVGALTGTDGRSVSAQAPIAIGDTGTLIGGDNRSLAVSPSRSDTGTITGVASASVAVTVGATDVGALTGTESSSVVIPTLSVSQADSGTIGGSETVTVATAVAQPDTGILTGSESAPIVQPMTGVAALDVGAITGLSSASVLGQSAYSIGDHAAIVGVETASVSPSFAGVAFAGCWSLSTTGGAIGIAAAGGTLAFEALDGVWGVDSAASDWDIVATGGSLVVTKGSCPP